MLLHFESFIFLWHIMYIYREREKVPKLFIRMIFMQLVNRTIIYSNMLCYFDALESSWKRSNTFNDFSLYIAVLGLPRLDKPLTELTWSKRLTVRHAVGLNIDHQTALIALDKSATSRCDRPLITISPYHKGSYSFWKTHCKKKFKILVIGPSK